MTTESDQIETLQKKLAAKEQAITCPLLAKLLEQVKCLEARHAEDIAENISELNK